MLISDKILSVASILYPSMNSSLEGISADLFLKGCKRHCPGCHNLELQTFDKPNTSTAQVVEVLNKHTVHILTLMGGEPLDMDTDTLLFFVQEVHKQCPGIRINLYTGYELDEIDPRLIGYFGSIKTGFFDQNNLNKQPSFLASSNQKYFQRNQQGNLVKVYP